MINQCDKTTVNRRRAVVVTVAIHQHGVMAATANNKPLIVCRDKHDRDPSGDCDVRAFIRMCSPNRSLLALFM